jgi:cytochrome c-type biogenesis protein CcsB
MIESKIFTFSMICYLIAFVAYSISVSLGKKNQYTVARSAIFIGFMATFIGLGLRWKTAGHPPLSNMYESLVFLSTFLAFAGFLFTRKNPLPLLEAGSSVGAVLMIGIASVFSDKVRPLIPALQSYWLHLHVSLAFVGEACFAIAFILSYLYCFRIFLDGSEKESMDFKERAVVGSIVIGLPATFLLGMISLAIHLGRQDQTTERSLNVVLWVIIPTCLALAVIMLISYLFRGALGKQAEKWLPEPKVLDNLTYRAIALGYPLFTVGGLIFGMVWANKAWGRYWGWDPKETWALITFLVYSAYLHVRLTRGWKGLWTACLSLLGFLVTMFTLFGVNLLVSSLHSYA